MICRRLPADIRETDCYRLTADIREKDCSHLRRGRFFRNYSLYGYRRGGTFDSPKVPKSDSGLRPKNPTHRNARPESQSDGFPERGLNGAYKVSQMHLPPPNLPRFGGGERPPFSCKPPAPLTITMGQRLVLFASPISLRALNFPFSIARPSGPLSRLGKGGGGKGQMRCGYLGSDSVRSTD